MAGHGLNEPMKIQLGLSIAMLQNLETTYKNLDHINVRSLEFQVFSQFGEDGILNFLCEKLKISKPRVLEIGVEDFQECNSRFLAYSRNASIVAVDKYPLHEKFLSESNLRWKNTIEAWTCDVNPDNINEIYHRAEDLIGTIDIFSLDIDGVDFWVLKNLEVLNAKILVLEFNALFGSNKSVSVPYEDNFDRTSKHFSNKYYGCSLTALIGEAGRKNYQFIGTNRACNNAFFIKKNLLDQNVFELEKLNNYVDLTFRESRNMDGSLTYFSSTYELQILSEMYLIETNSNKLIKIKDL
jgi:hypothetical protein